MPTFSGGVFLTVLTVAPKAGIGIEVDVYASDGVTMLATLENAREVQFQDQRNQPGSGSFKINRHDAKATATILQRSNIVRIKLGGVYRYAYRIESVSRTVVSKDGQGAEDVVVAGRGVLSLLEHGVLYPAGWPAAKVNPRAWSAVPFATVLDTAYTEAIARGCFPSVTRDWSSSTDSIARAWSDVQSPSLNVGTSLLDLALQGASLGYDIGMSPTLVWHVWNGTQGVDRSAGSLTPVIFRQGKHFGHQDFTDMIVDGPVITDMIVTGSGGLMLEVTDPALRSQPGVGRREGTFDYSSGQTNQDLSNAGNAAIAHLQVDANPLQLTVTHGTSANNSGDYEPYVDYFLGDTITIDAPPIYSLANYVVEAFTIAQIADSEAYTVTIDLNSVFLDADILMWNKLGGASVGGSSGVSGLSSGGVGTNSGALATVSSVQGDQPGYLDSKIASAGINTSTKLTGALGNQSIEVDLNVAKGTHAARPAASTLPNAFYYETDTPGLFYSDGTAWNAIGGGGGGGGSLALGWVGTTTPGTSFEAVSSLRTYCQKFTLTKDTLIDSAAVYLQYAGAYNVGVMASVYTDSSGPSIPLHNAPLPGRIGPPASPATQWITVPLGCRLAAGTFWLAVAFTNVQGVAPNIAFATGGSDQYFALNSNGGGEFDSAPTLTTTSNTYSIKATTLS